MANINLPEMTLTAFQNIQSLLQDGDTLILPEGTLDFGSTEVDIPKTYDILGAGMDKTFLKCHSTSVYDVQPIHFTNLKDIPFRLSGMAFIDTEAGTKNYNFLKFSGVCKSFRIDNCDFSDGGAHSIMMDGDIEGVIDHCVFPNDSTESISIRNSQKQDEIWNTQPSLGTIHNVFIEDCTFNFATKGTHAVTAVNGARVVFRKNTINCALTGAMIDFHGNYENDRSTYSFEVYDNQIINNSSTWIAYGVYARGGKGVIFNNTIAGRFSNSICLTNYRSWTSNSTHPAVCTEVVNGTTYNCNVHLYLDARTYDSLREVYVWGNTKDGVPIGATVLNRGHDRDHIQLGRDYFETAMPGYTPFEYPHPLTIEQGENNMLEKTFTIENLGDLDLTVTSVVCTGDSSFTVDTTDLVSPVIGLGSSTFKVRFQPLTVGAKSAVINIVSNDNDENPYIINVTGNGITMQEINVKVDGVDVLTNGSVNFGNVIIG